MINGRNEITQLGGSFPLTGMVVFLHARNDFSFSLELKITSFLLLQIRWSTCCFSTTLSHYCIVPAKSHQN